VSITHPHRPPDSPDAERSTNGVAAPPDPQTRPDPSAAPSEEAPPGGDGREGAAPPPPPPRSIRHGLPWRRLLLVALAILAIVGGGVVGYRWWQDSLLYVSTDNAQVAGYMIQIGTLDAGRVSAVNVDVGDRVSTNQVVAQVEVPTAVSQTAAGTPRLQFTDTVDNQIAVRATGDGIVVARNANPGDVLPAGQSILTVVDPSRLWIVANVEETSIQRVRPGQRVSIHVDNLNADFSGTVSAIVQASAQSFSPLPQMNLSGSYTKVTQLQPVKIVLDTVDPRLALGTSVEVKIEVGP
jgi:multidrug resistance efflux pump